MTYFVNLGSVLHMIGCCCFELLAVKGVKCVHTALCHSRCLDVKFQKNELRCRRLVTVWKFFSCKILSWSWLFTMQHILVRNQGVVLQSLCAALWIGREVCTYSNGEFIMDKRSHKFNLEHPKSHTSGLPTV